MPVVHVHFPGSGITPFNVLDLPLQWWLVYRTHAKAVIAAQKKTRK